MAAAAGSLAWSERRSVTSETVCGGPGVGGRGVVGACRAVDPHVTDLGVFLTAHPGLGAGRGWPGGTFDPAVAPATAAIRCDRRMGRAGADLVDLHPARPGYPVPRHGGAAAGAGHRAGDRRRLCHPRVGSGSCVVPSDDARGRPDLVFVVSVALAGAATDAAVAGRTSRPAERAGRNRGLRRAGADHHAPGRKPRPVHRRSAPVGEGQPGSGRRRQRGRGVRVPAAAHGDAGAGRSRHGRPGGEYRRATFVGLPHRQAARS